MLRNNKIRKNKTKMLILSKFLRFLSQSGHKFYFATTLVYNFTKGSFSFFDLLSFSKDDQSLADTILSFMKPNDLVICDMGLFALDVLEEIHCKGTYFLTRKSFTE
jgi:hypothetical protein